MADATYYEDADWGDLILGRSQLPGKWTVEGDCDRRIDKKRTKGSDGAKVKDQGYEPAELTLVGLLGGGEKGRAEFNALTQALKDIHPRRKGSARDPLSIVHPATAVVGINLVIVRGVGVPKQLPNGLLEQKIRVLEWVPEPKNTGNKKPTPISWMNRGFIGVTTGREVLIEGTEIAKTDLGFAPPRDSAEEFLNPPPEDYVLGYQPEWDEEWTPLLSD